MAVDLDRMLEMARRDQWQIDRDLDWSVKPRDLPRALKPHHRIEIGAAAEEPLDDQNLVRRQAMRADAGGRFDARHRRDPLDPFVHDDGTGREIAEPLGAERAERLGFVNRLVEPGMALDVALGLAATITENAPLAVRESLALAHAEINGDETGDWAASHAALDRLLVSEDVREGIDAFFERRDPVWRGR